MNIPPKYLENIQLGTADSRSRRKSALKAFDAICCNFSSQKSHRNGLIESDEMAYEASLGGPVSETNLMQVLSVVGHQDQFMTVIIIITSSNVIGGHMEQ